MDGTICVLCMCKLMKLCPKHLQLLCTECRGYRHALGCYAAFSCCIESHTETVCVGVAPILWAVCSRLHRWYAQPQTIRIGTLMISRGSEQRASRVFCLFTFCFSLLPFFPHPFLQECQCQSVEDTPKGSYKCSGKSCHTVNIQPLSLPSLLSLHPSLPS